MQPLVTLPSIEWRALSFASILLVSLFVLNCQNGVEGLLAPPPICTAQVQQSGMIASETWSCAIQSVIALYGFENSFEPVFLAHNKTLFNNLNESLFSVLWESIEEYYPIHAAELNDISSTFSNLGHYVSVEYLAAWVWFHELAHTTASTLEMPTGCTAVITRRGDAKGFFHARNMDQTPSQARNLTVHFLFKNPNSTDPNDIWFEAVDWYWITTGFMTGVKKGVISVQENWRDASKPFSVEDIVSYAANGVIPQVFLFRESFQRNYNPKDLLASWSQVQLASPMYVIATSSDDAVIITRDVDTFRATAMDATAWFLVQTNYDPWLPDNPEDPRRTHAIAMLNAFGYTEAMSLSPLGAYAIAVTPGVLNNDTAYTSVMDPMNPSTQSSGLPLCVVHN
eukprot:m.24487 g.24487  ORF g.24487 m.24487 type:complete len:397 (+) comp5659_c0_seq1:169-1359(+)